MQRILFWGLFGLTLSVYGTMLGWSLPTISTAAGGLVPFDMRPGGYGFDEAHAFLSALSADGKAFYIAVQQKLDFAYPALIALTLFFSIAATATQFLGRWRWVPAVLVVPVAIFDYLENHAIALMLGAGAVGLSPDLVVKASQWTVLKSTMTAAAMIVLLAFLVLQVARFLLQFWQSRPHAERRPVGSASR